jgi:hypothetical protein
MLILSGRTAISDEILDELERLRTLALAAGGPEPLEVAGTVFGVAGYNRRRYRFVLLHRLGEIHLTTSVALPACRVQVRSELLHAVGAEEAFAWFAERLEDWLGPIAWSVSRIDLHADWQGWPLQATDLTHFVCRAKSRATYDSNPEWTGFLFGKRSSGTIQARIYDKTAEIAEKGGSAWPEVWGERYDPAAKVIRVEFEFNREGLREFLLDTPQEVLGAAGALWVSATQWLTHRTPTGDATKSRWPVSEYWQAVQRATLVGTAVPLERFRELAEAAQYERIVQGLGGYLVSLAALEQATSAEEVVRFVPIALRHWEHISGRSFHERLERRVSEWRFR